MATTATCPRGFPNLTMPATSSERPQNSRTGGLPGSHLYANHDIWTSTMSSVHGRSVGAQASTSRKASNEDVPRKQPLRSRHSPSDDNAAGSSALNANSEADWSCPWNSEHLGRSVSTSPSRPRDGGHVSATGYLDQKTAAIGSRIGGFTSQPYHEVNVFASAFSTVGRSAQDLSAYSVDSITGYGYHHEASLPPSRHSQNSPAYQDLYRASHTPNNSVSQSVRGAYTSQGQSLNQRAFNFNNRIDEEFSTQLNRRLALDSPSGPAASFNTPSQPFQLNPGTVPWNSGGNGLCFGAANVYLSAEGHAANYAGVWRSPVERVPSGSGYCLDSGGNCRGYSDPWQARSAPCDARQGDVDRRAVAQNFASAYNGAFNAHFPYAGFATNFVDVNQNFRQHPMMPPFGLPNLAIGFSPAGGIVPATRRDQDPGKGIRSPLLEEFRTTHRSNRRWELKEIFNHIVEFSGDQHGSRFIQQKLETANSEEKEQVFCEIEPNAIQLMKDVFGNYVVQKFYEHGNQVQKKVLSDKMRGRAYDLSVQVYGCRVVQKALEHILVEQQAELTKELEPEILRVIKDQNGNHVVQKIIELVPRKHLDFVMSAIRGQMTGLASHTYGCRVVQRMLEHGTSADRLEIMTELHASAQILLTDQYGNYVAQHVIEHGKTKDRQKMIELVMSQLVTLSKHKFASNVVEKCIQFGSAANKAMILNLLTATSDDGSSTLQQLMRDQYGNYVIQKLLGVLEGPNRDGLVEEIKSQLFVLKKSGATKKLQALEKLLGDGSKDGFSAKNGSSARCTPPPLTNESSSPVSSNPPSTRASTVGLPGAQLQDVKAAKADGDETPI